MKKLLLVLSLFNFHCLGQSILLKPNDDGIISKNVALCSTCATFGNTVPVSGGGTRLMWLPKLSAFRAGTVENNTNYWDTGLVGNWSFAGGYNTVAKGNWSTAFGLQTRVLANLGTAFGWQVEANDFTMFACGSFNVIPIGSTDIFNPNEQLFAVGNGTSEANRKNAFTILKNGNTGIGIADPISSLDIQGSNLGFRSHFNYKGDSSEDTYIRGGKVGSQVLINDVAGLGSVGIGLNNPNEILDINGRARIRHNGSTSGIWMSNSTNSLSSADGAFYGMKTDTETGFYIGNGWRFWINSAGNGYLNGNLIQTSDKRLKKNFLPIKNSLSSIYKLNGYQFNWTEEARSRDLQTGLIAQEVQKIFPELVQTDEKGFLSVNYIGLVPHLIESIKELRDENNSLKTKNQTLESRLDKIEAILSIIQPNTEKSNSKK
ncbi:hypothetical protein GCM10011514_02700 [Emticicia aquatilis]|uniref:Peptidase S74 domain-containing protein n=1 Tax=Emticicia aquatilis TaxID=1537369 RepID=A0A916YF81_9BACT|nr:tail fiber domain-containing protein [Emticicia aquatilis]GGD42188.1 hypothetical protein GCM10011514_02700 [Emticicia aquatilis]